LTEEELPELKKLYEKLRSDAMEVAKDLSRAKLVYRIVGIASVIFGAVPMALGISSLVLTIMVGLPLFDWSFPSMVMSIVIGLVLIALGGMLLNKSEDLERKYGKLEDLRKLV